MPATDGVERLPGEYMFDSIQAREFTSLVDIGSKSAVKGSLDVVHVAGGIRTIGWLKTWKSDYEAAQQAQKLGLDVIPLSSFTIKYKQPPALMLGFASCNPAELRRGVSVLATALRSR